MTPKATFSATSIVASLPSYDFDASPDAPVTLKQRVISKGDVATGTADEVKHINVSSLISRHDYVGTCRAEYDGIRFVLKFVVSPERDPTPVFKLAMEAELYEGKLASLQGDAIPHYYGFFEGKDDQDWNVACIILEDCGDAVGGLFFNLPLPDRANILMALGKVHQSGVQPMDFSESNVVHANGDFRVIDFEDVYLKHVCKWKGQFFPGEEFPARKEVGCGGLYDTAAEMRIWRFNREWYDGL